MPHVEFEKWLCQLSLILYFSIFHVDFKMVSCRMSNVRNSLCHIDDVFFHVNRFHVTCRFEVIAVLPCRI